MIPTEHLHPPEPALIGSDEDLVRLLRRHGAKVLMERVGPGLQFQWPYRAVIQVTDGKLLVGLLAMTGEVYLPPVQHIQVVEPIKVSTVRIINPGV
jgi:hypothetical protein